MNTLQEILELKDFDNNFGYLFEVSKNNGITYFKKTALRVDNFKNYIHARDKKLLEAVVEMLLEEHKDNPSHNKDELWGCPECYEDRVKERFASLLQDLIK